MITIITPTGDRPESFALCEYWMSRQTYRGELQWIVVDDGEKSTCCTAGQEHVRREPDKSDPQHTLGVNLKQALPHVRGDSILFIEDDDYYSPKYIETMVEWLRRGDIVGERGARYYFLRDRGYYFWTDHRHASLCRTGINRPAFKTLQHVVDRSNGDWMIDMRLWDQFKGRRHLVDARHKGRAMCVGMKQMPGREGVNHYRMQSTTDSSGAMLREWIGEDAKLYRRFQESQEVKGLVTYTCLFGVYDKVRRAPGGASYMVTDNPGPAERQGWKTIVPDRTFETPKRASRYWKMHSHELFPDRPTLYLDSNVTLKESPRSLAAHMSGASLTAFLHNRSKTIRDEITNCEKLLRIPRERMENDIVRENYDLPVAWGGCLLRMPECVEFNRLWWELFQGLARDQMVLPIALEESGVHYRLLNEPTPFFGDKSRWMDVSSHIGKRQLV